VTLEENPDHNPGKLSPTSLRMLALRDAVFAEWEKRVRGSVEQAGGLRHPILINTLPTFYDKIAEAVTPDFPRANAISTTTIATEHGGERARLTNYDPKAIIAEYQTLRASMLDVLKQNGVHFSDEEMLVIDASIDGAIRESVNAYVIALAALREQFIAALTHDLRNPLATANMAAQLISRTSDSPQIKEIAARIIENHNRMDQMIHHLLDSMIFQTGGRLRLTLSGFDILELVKDVCNQASATHGPRFHIIGEPAEVCWSKEDIKRALENLIGNAIKYGAPDTPITIKIDRIDERLLLSVHNHGKPIPLEERDDIFQIFKRARAARESTKEGWGIGLPFVRGVAESHGGSIEVDSSIERGTTFSFDIPLDARPYQNAPTLGVTDPAGL
jgi:signal transduction histidine kinase